MKIRRETYRKWLHRQAYEMTSGIKLEHGDNMNQNRDITDIERKTMRKVTLRILPFLIICYFFAYLDRVNVGIAALQMNDDVGLTSAAFGFGSGVFFIGYFLFEVPSNMIMARVGARRWLARIMITWGALAAMMVFVEGPVSFSVVRFLLGAAEAGFFPGVILYITYFFPAAYRARIVAIFATGVPLSLFVGSTMSAGLLQMHGFLGVTGWKWMFLIEAVPSIILGFLCLGLLSDKPALAGWLTSDEREWLQKRLDKEAAMEPIVAKKSLLRLLFDSKVLALGYVYAGTAAASVGLAVWQPQIIKSHGLTSLQAGMLNSVPYAVAVIAMLVWGWMSDKSSNRFAYTVIPLLAISVALASTGLIDSLPVTVLALTLAAMGTYAVKGPFWAFVTERFTVAEAAVVYAEVTAIGALGSFLGSWLFGLVRGMTGSYFLGLLPIVAMTLSGIVVLVAISTRVHVRQVA